MRILIFLLLTVIANAQPRWEYAGPWGAPISDILLAPSGELIADTRNGLFISSDKGISWTPTGAERPWDIELGAISPTTGTIVAERYDARTRGWRPVYSTDNGRTWDSARIGFDRVYLNYFSVSPAGTFYIGAVGKSFRSTDDGRSWERIGEEPFDVVEILTLDDSTLIASISGIDDGNQPALDRSSDGGRTWERIMTMQNYIRAFAIDSSGGLWGITRNEVLRSVDSGRRWVSAAPPWAGTPFSVIAVTSTGSIMLTSNWGPIARSTDNGASWDTLSTNNTHFDAGAMVALPSSELLIGNYTAAGIISSTDEGESWSPRNAGIPAPVGYVVAARGRLAIQTDGRGAEISNDRGGSWELHPRPGGGVWQMPVVTDAGTYIIQHADGNRSADRSTDGAATWSRYKINASFASTFRPFANGAGDLFGFAAEKLAISTNDGIDWSSSTLPAGFGSTGIAAFEGRTAGYLGSYNGIARTLDNGATWTIAHPGSVDAITVDRSGRVLAMTDDGIVLSDNRGATWRIVADTSISFTSLASSPDGSILGGTKGRGVWRSIDAGATWLPFSEGLSDNVITSIAVDATTGDVFAGTEYGGLFRLVGLVSSVSGYRPSVYLQLWLR